MLCLLKRSIRAAGYQRRALVSLHCQRLFATATLPTSTLVKPLQAPLALRPYQGECIQAILNAFGEGRRQVGVSLATGSGKTVIFTELIHRVLPSTKNAVKSLILVHRRELVEQAARQCSRRYPDKTVEIEMGSLIASGQADITIASIQSINSRDRIDKFDPETFKLIIVDEAHHIVSPAYLKVLGHFGLVNNNKGEAPGPTIAHTPALVGVSATMSRLDGVALGKVIKHIVFHKDYVDMIEEKWLSEVLFTTVATNADLTNVKSGLKGDFLTSALSEAVNTDETNLVTVRAWQHKAAQRKSTIVFCVDLNHVMSLTNTFRAHGIDARFITGDTRKDIRGERLDDFRNGKFPVLVNCEILTEGTDIPNIDCVLLARPTKSRNLLVQMIGRGMRLHPDKKNCHVIDMVASLKTGIVTTPTLFGLDPRELLQDLSPEKIRQLKDRKEQESLRQQAQGSVGADTAMAQRGLRGTMKFTDYESVSDLIEDASGERHIRAISPHAWVQVDEGRYVLINGAAGSYLTLEKLSQDSFEVKITLKLTSTSGTLPFAKPRVIVKASNFEAAVHGADTYASKHFTRLWVSLYTRDGWRERPASQAQVDFLNKFRGEEDQLLPTDVTKGKAGDMITKIRFGARGRFAKVAKNKQRESKKQLREVEKRKKFEMGRGNEEVVVGPLGEYAGHDSVPSNASI